MARSSLDLNVDWYAGVRARTAGRGGNAAPIQIHRAAEDTIILRQSMTVNFEGAFLYLLFGEERALLLDTGATADAAAFPLRTTVDSLVSAWLARHSRPGYQLVVAHSHAHGDHIAADAQFDHRPNTVVVGHTPEAVAEFFGVADWPTGEGELDLGARRLTVLPIPGHQPASIALWDDLTEVLLTGDTLYPGRLYARDFPAFVASIDRLCDFVDGHPVSTILGAHIEASTKPGYFYPMGVTWHPNEAPLPMTVEQLRRLRAGLAASTKPGVHTFGDFAVWIGRCRGAVAREILRFSWWRVRGR